MYIIDKNNIHARRIWRLGDPNSSELINDYISESLSDIYQVIERVDSIQEFSDNHVKHGSKHSLKFYRSFDFNMPQPSKRLYGDYRDGGFIISLNRNDSKIEGLQYSFKELEQITSK